jgi:hypothetical protein
MHSSRMKTLAILLFAGTILYFLSVHRGTLPVFAAIPAASAPTPQQFPMLDKVADKLIQKYQSSSCEQLWVNKSKSQSQPKTTEQQELISILRNDPQMRTVFINKVAPPIANKMFDCGMIP